MQVGVPSESACNTQLCQKTSPSNVVGFWQSTFFWPWSQYVATNYDAAPLNSTQYQPGFICLTYSTACTQDAVAAGFCSSWQVRYLRSLNRVRHIRPADMHG